MDEVTEGDPVPYAASGLPREGSSLVDMLHHINELEVIPQLQDSAVVANPESVVQPSATHLEKDKFPRVGRPRIRPTRERSEWHYHLGGVRHCRVPLDAELKEVLEVAYVSRIMSKNFRKEGQPEKERLARITKMDIDKVQEWFKNRRKKERLLHERALGRNLPKCDHSRNSTRSGTSVSEPNSNIPL